MKEEEEKRFNTKDTKGSKGKESRKKEVSNDE